MNLAKKIIISLGTLIVGIPLFTLVTNNSITTTTLSNNFFMFSLLFIIIGTSIAVLSSGFFDFFQKNMKNLIQQRRKNEPKEYIPLSEIFKKKPIYWFIVGGTLLIISFLLTLFS